MGAAAENRYKKFNRNQIEREHPASVLPGARQTPYAELTAQKTATASKHQCKVWMAQQVSQGFAIDDCCEIDYTKLAESCATAIGVSTWLDDSDHWIWDIAITIGDKYLQVGIDHLSQTSW
jgi:hypothetical protein